MKPEQSMQQSGGDLVGPDAGLDALAKVDEAGISFQTDPFEGFSFGHYLQMDSVHH